MRTDTIERARDCRRAREIDYTQTTDPTAQRERVHTTEMTDTCPPPTPDKPTKVCGLTGLSATWAVCALRAVRMQFAAQRCALLLYSCMLHHQRHRAAPIGRLHTYSWPSAGVNLACGALARYFLRTTRARTRCYVSFYPHRHTRLLCRPPPLIRYPPFLATPPVEQTPDATPPTP